ncbi:glycoside hydrolase [Pterulicium gracile]|uniref:Glycoside hydrolase n=1 Tax=Pterulicium gracile TaxID=1884261 RepID=A0A5C3QHV1_9AGAR|nr:glycoside hydrolase [Pterula gracilis]
MVNMVHLPLILLQIVSVIQLASATSYCTLKRPESSSNSVTGSDGVPRDGGALRPNEVLATAWYPGWLGDRFPVANLPWSKYSALTYAFGVTTPDVNVISLEESNESLLPQFVAMAHENNVMAFLSIGGWSGSIYFSTAVATPENRTAFVQTILGLVSKYDLDGIDFDWEYPNRQGLECNTISPADSANFLLFLQELRFTTQGTNLFFTAAAGIAPFMGPDGAPMADVSEFAKVLNWVAIMAYDIHGSWSPSAGPNAPLNDTCAPSPQGSAISAVLAWTAAGFPSSQLLLGVAAYGHSFHVDPTALSDALGATGGGEWSHPPFDKSRQPLGDSLDSTSTVGSADQCGVPGTGLPSGVWNFRGLVEKGYLDADGEPRGDAGIRYMWDECSQTPFIYDEITKAVISYDDARSFAAKGNFIKDEGIRGFAMWHAVGDYEDMLVDSIIEAMDVCVEETYNDDDEY